MSDVGLPGHIDDVPIWDLTGLTWRDIALNRTERDSLAPIRARDRIYSEQGGVFAMRLNEKGGNHHTAPNFNEAFPISETGLETNDVFTWRAKHEHRASRELVERRWRQLSERFPSIPWLTWHHALSLADLGRFDQAMELVRESQARFPAFRAWRNLPSSLLLPTELEAEPLLTPEGWNRLTTNQTRLTRPIEEDELEELLILLDAEDPGPEGAAFSLGWASPCLPCTVTGSAHSPTAVVPPPALCPEHAERRLAVAFTNDLVAEWGDRTLLVSQGSRADRHPEPEGPESGQGRTVSPPGPAPHELNPQDGDVKGGPSAVTDDMLELYANGTVTWTAPVSGFLDLTLSGTPAGGRGPRVDILASGRGVTLRLTPEPQSHRLTFPVWEGDEILLRFDDDLHAQGEDRNVAVHALRIVQPESCGSRALP